MSSSSRKRLESSSLMISGCLEKATTNKLNQRLNTKKKFKDYYFFCLIHRMSYFPFMSSLKQLTQLIFPTQIEVLLCRGELISLMEKTSSFPRTLQYTQMNSCTVYMYLAVHCTAIFRCAVKMYLTVYKLICTPVLYYSCSTTVPVCTPPPGPPSG